MVSITSRVMILAEREKAMAALCDCASPAHDYEMIKQDMHTSILFLCPDRGVRPGPDGPNRSFELRRTLRY